MQPENSKQIRGDRVEFTLDTVEPSPGSAKPVVAETAAPKPAKTRPDTAQWLIRGGIAAATAGTVIMLALPRTPTSGPAEAPATPAAAPAPTVAAPPPEIESTPPPTWTGTPRATWTRGGAKIVTFSLASTRDVPVWMNHARPSLVVRCLDRTTEAFVMLETSTSHEQDADRRTVSVQWDDEPLKTQYWGVSESGHELFAPDGKEFVVRAAGARTLRFGFTPFNASPVTAEFAVQGFDKLAGLVAGTCGWRLAPAS